MTATVKNVVLFVVCLALPAAFVVVNERAAAVRMESATAAADDVPIASVAEDTYCTQKLKQVVRRVASACGLLESGSRGCKPADAKAVAALTGDDFNSLFKPLSNRARILQFDLDQVQLDAGAMQAVEEVWAEKRGASFFFVVSRASADGGAAHNAQLSQGRARAVMSHLEDQFGHDEDLKKIGLLWLGEEFAQLGAEFCDWSRSRPGTECGPQDINRSAFVAWIDCAI